MHVVSAPIVDNQSESVDTSDARREWWFSDLYSQLFNGVSYANSALSLVEVRDLRGLRYSLKMLALKSRLAQAAVDKISELDALQAGSAR
jgi:hypothetical protein